MLPLAEKKSGKRDKIKESKLTMVYAATYLGTRSSKSSTISY